MSQVSPATKAARQAQIASILEQVAVRSQDELADWLAHRGVRVTQTTLSRDLEELGAVKLRTPDGGQHAYVVPEDVRALAYPILRHRILLNFHAESERVKPDDVVRRLIETVPEPKSGL